MKERQTPKLLILLLLILLVPTVHISYAMIQGGPEALSNTLEQELGFLGIKENETTARIITNALHLAYDLAYVESGIEEAANGEGVIRNLLIDG